MFFWGGNKHTQTDTHTHTSTTYPLATYTPLHVRLSSLAPAPPDADPSPGPKANTDTTNQTTKQQQPYSSHPRTCIKLLSTGRRPLARKQTQTQTRTSTDTLPLHMRQLLRRALLDDDFLARGQREVEGGEGRGDVEGDAVVLACHGLGYVCVSVC